MLGRDEEALESFRTSTYLWSLPGTSRGTCSANRASCSEVRPAAYEGFGQAYFRLGQSEQAFQVYSQAIAIDPTDANGFAGRADVLADAQAARRRRHRLFRGDPARLRRIRGPSAGEGSSAPTRAMTSSRWPTSTARSRSIRSSPRPTRTGACVYARRGENEQALADYDALIRLLPNNAGRLQGSRRRFWSA